MIRMQIQLPEPLLHRLKRIADERDWSFAELVRRGMESYACTFPDASSKPKEWVFPTLRGSGGHLMNVSECQAESMVIEERFNNSKDAHR
jgi:hypothetical protein